MISLLFLLRSWLGLGNVVAGFLGALLALAPVVTSQDFPGAGKVTLVHDGFQFTEGPAYDGSKYLYFTDIPSNRILRTDLRGELEVFLENSRSCNGLMVDGEGKLIGCQMKGSVVAWDVSTRESRTLTDRFQDAPYNACNDLVIDKSGGIYFTDPRYGAPDPWPQGKEAFYYRAANGSVTRLGDELIAPNGIILAPDEKTLYVVPSMQKQIMAYPVFSPGRIGPGRVLIELKQPEGKDNTGGDGLAIDVLGNLYITAELGVQVVSPKGELLGILTFPEQPANCAFGGADRKTLFATCRTGLYRVSLPYAGHVFSGRVP
jgi:gluconolactonase